MSGQVGRRLLEFRESIIVGELDERVVEVSYGRDTAGIAASGAHRCEVLS